MESILPVSRPPRKIHLNVGGHCTDDEDVYLMETDFQLETRNTATNTPLPPPLVSFSRLSHTTSMPTYSGVCIYSDLGRIFMGYFGYREDQIGFEKMADSDNISATASLISLWKGQIMRAALLSDPEITETTLASLCDAIIQSCLKVSVNPVNASVTFALREDICSENDFLEALLAHTGCHKVVAAGNDRFRHCAQNGTTKLNESGEAVSKQQEKQQPARRVNAPTLRAASLATTTVKCAERNPDMIKMMAAIRKQGMDVIFPQEIHDKVLACIFVVMQELQCGAHRDLIDAIMFFKHTGVLDDDKAITKTKIRGILALLKQACVLHTETPDGSPVKLVMAPDVASLLDLRWAHDSYLERCMSACIENLDTRNWHSILWDNSDIAKIRNRSSVLDGFMERVRSGYAEKEALARFIRKLEEEREQNEAAMAPSSTSTPASTKVPPSTSSVSAEAASVTASRVDAVRLPTTLTPESSGVYAKNKQEPSRPLMTFSRHVNGSLPPLQLQPHSRSAALLSASAYPYHYSDRVGHFRQESFMVERPLASLRPQYGYSLPALSPARTTVRCLSENQLDRGVHTSHPLRSVPGNDMFPGTPLRRGSAIFPSVPSNQSSQLRPQSAVDTTSAIISREFSFESTDTVDDIWQWPQCGLNASHDSEGFTSKSCSSVDELSVGWGDGPPPGMAPPDISLFELALDRKAAPHGGTIDSLSDQLLPKLGGDGMISHSYQKRNNIITEKGLDGDLATPHSPRSMSPLLDFLG